MLRRIRELIERRRLYWESLCHRCGLCCYEKEMRHGIMYVRLDAPCPHLDTNTRLCRVYERRFSVCKECRKLTYFHARFSRWLPQSCGYVQHFRRRKPQ